MTMVPGGNEGGFTLIEMLIALMLFALISLAGVALIEAVIGAQRRTDNRLERLAALQRTSYLINSDLSQMAAGSLVGTDRGIRFGRHSAAAAGESDMVQYRLTGHDLVRSVGARPHTLLNAVAGLRVLYLEQGGGWRETWPPPDVRDAAPSAIDLSISLDAAAGAPGGMLRRIVALPTTP